MKKILLIIFCIIFCGNYSFGSEINSDIKFIYLNGANANNEKKKQDFIKGLYNVQKYMKEYFENNECICSNLLNNGNYKINEIPDVLFWGFYSKDDLNSANNILENYKKYSPFLAQKFRSFLVHNIHDIIWIKRDSNMHLVTDELQKMILEASCRKEKVIIAGHSAGSFITYNYLLNKAKSFNVDTYTGKNESKFSCTDAIVKSGLGYRLINGKLEKNPNEYEFLSAYEKLDEITDTECMPDNTVLGALNFGSALSLFYPDRLKEPNSSAYIYQLNLLKYLQKNNMFFLTVNFSDDPLSLPEENNYSKSEYECMLDIELDSNAKGFVYNYSRQRSPSPFWSAHYTYWKHPKKFSQISEKGYVEGFNNFYK